MSNPASAVFEKYAETGFYTATTAEPVITITVRDAKGSGTGAGNVEFTYDSVAKNWKYADGTETVPKYFNAADAPSKTEIILVSKKDSLEGTPSAGDWMITVSNMSDYAIPAKQSETSVNDYLNRVITDVQLVWGNGKAAKRTVYMDSNIALTDGTDAVSTGKAKTIPNLYEAIQDMDTRIDRIDKEYGVSTADAGLFVTHHASGNNPYKSFIREDNTNAIEITAGNMLNASRKLNATGPGKASGKDYNMHFKANEITFTVTNPNATVTAYQITADKIAETTLDVYENNDNALHTLLNDTAFSGKIAISYYWVPVEDMGPDEYINTIDKKILYGAHGKIMMTDARNGSTSEEELKAITNGDKVVAFINSGKSEVYIPHTEIIATGGIGFEGTGGTTINLASEMTYNLGAIIEAIQELNRRTMFMDTDMSFSGAMSYNDHSAETTPGSAYGAVIDGLPAGTDNNLHKSPTAA